MGLGPGQEDESEPAKEARSQARDLRVDSRNGKQKREMKAIVELTSLSLNDQAVESIVKETGCSHSEGLRGILNDTGNCYGRSNIN